MKSLTSINGQFDVKNLNGDYAIIPPPIVSEQKRVNKMAFQLNEGLNKKWPNKPS